MMDARDVGVGVIVAAAGGLAWALCRSSGWLLGGAGCLNGSSSGSTAVASIWGGGWVSRWGAGGANDACSTTGPTFLGLRGWQWLNLGAFVVNVVSVSLPGRIDGKMAEEAKKAAKAAKEDASKEAASGVPRDSMYRSLVTPAGWAFAIWGVIYATEMGFIVAQSTPASSLSSGATAAYAGVSPWWAMACGLQALWCAAFRDWTRSPRHFWISGALLAAEAVALGGAHRVLRALARADAGMTAPVYLSCHLPLALHFGWITAAAVVNANSYIAVAHAAPHVQLSLAFASVWCAAALGVSVTIASGDPTVAGVLGWALAAVAADGGRRAKETLGETPLAALTHSAATAAKALVGVGVVVGAMRAMGAM